MSVAWITEHFCDVCSKMFDNDRRARLRCANVDCEKHRFEASFCHQCFLQLAQLDSRVSIVRSIGTNGGQVKQPSVDSDEPDTILVATYFAVQRASSGDAVAILCERCVDREPIRVLRAIDAQIGGNRRLWNYLHVGRQIRQNHKIAHLLRTEMPTIVGRGVSKRLL